MRFLFVNSGVSCQKSKWCPKKHANSDKSLEQACTSHQCDKFESDKTATFYITSLEPSSGRVDTATILELQAISQLHLQDASCGTGSSTLQQSTYSHSMAVVQRLYDNCTPCHIEKVSLIRPWRKGNQCRQLAGRVMWLPWRAFATELTSCHSLQVSFREVASKSCQKG